MYKKLNLSSSPGPLTDIDRIPEFPPGPATFFPNPNVSSRAEDFFEKGDVLTYEAVSSHLPGRFIPFYSYLQIKHFLLS